MKTKFAILGAGKLGSIVARAWKSGKMPEYGWSAFSVGRRTPLKLRGGGRRGLDNSTGRLLRWKPQIVAEAASVPRR